MLFALTLLLVVPAALPVATADSGRRFKTIARTFTQADGITIDPAPNAVGPVAPYPSSLIVSGIKRGRIEKIYLTLYGFSHQNPRDVDILLVKRDAGSRTAVVLSDIGGEAIAETNLTLTLADKAAGPLPADGSLDSGIFRPTNADLSSDVFPAPAPAIDTNSALDTFDGLTPNGEWRLFVVDDAAGNTGSIDAWELRMKVKVRTNHKR